MSKTWRQVLVLVLTLTLFTTGLLFSQSTVSTGSLQGTITDSSGAAVPNAKVTVTNISTGSPKSVTTNGSGFYNTGSLPPGSYRVRIEAGGFEAVETTVVVQVGNTAGYNAKLQVGSEQQTISVEATTIGVNTEQSSVQGVLSAEQIDQLPVNGRNFLDLAQLEPGVQIQDGTNFDPTKVGYQSISIGGRFGRTARIQVDGVDISDETVGTTTGDIPSSAIQEFQLAQSTMDLSNDLSSSGVVNVTTRSGSNQLHGEGFGLFRDSSEGAELPHPEGLDAKYQRSQFGGRLGGAIIKDKLFFFGDGERTLQHSFIPVQYAAPFTGFSGGYQSPFKTGDAIGKLDYKGPKGMNLFYRYSFSQIKAEGTYFSDALNPYVSKNYTRQHVIGADFTTGSFSHSLRYSYMKFQNEVGDASIGSGLPLSQAFGPGLYASIDINGGPFTGPNYLAPQSTPQQNNQIKYDGSKTWGRHIVRFGASYNHIQGGGFASFFGLAPLIEGNFVPGDDAIAATGPFPGGASNPLNYPIDAVIISNGQGYSTTQAALGFPAGGLGPDNRIGLYIADTWKVRSNFTINLGVRYDRDTGRTDSDLGTIPELNNIVPDFPNLGAPVPNPNKNFAPTFGIAWDPWNDHKTAIRAGIGLYYENVIFNNVLFDRPLRLKNGAFLQTALICNNGSAVPIPGYSFGATDAECSAPIGSSAAALAAIEQEFEAAVPFSTTSPNGNYIGSYVGNASSGGANFNSSGPGTAEGLFAPNYRSPRALEMNIGVQRELGPGTVLSVDYVRNVTTQLLLGIDLNHSGDVKYFNKAAAQTAIATVAGSVGCAGGFSSAAIDCVNAYYAANPSAGTAGQAFASAGLDSASDLGGAYACAAGGCAFPGLNPQQGVVNMSVPGGRSIYNALDIKLTHQIRHPLPGFSGFNGTFSYSLSSFKNCGGASPSTPGASDQDFVIAAIDNNHPCQFTGDSILDRRNQFSFGFIADTKGGFRLSMISHFYSPLSTSLVTTSSAGTGPGAIFQTDFTGDGTTQDLVPGTNVGAFGRSVDASNINTVLTNYNNNVAGQATPAGNVLINQGLFTLAQLQAAGMVAEPLTLAPSGQVNNDWLRVFDLKLSWVGRKSFGDHIIEIEPSFGVYNLFNFANFDLPPNTLSGLLTGSTGSINGTTYNDQASVRVGAGTGVFSEGAPRTIEWGLRIGF